MGTATSTGKGRTGSAKLARTLLGAGLVLVVLSCLAAFGLLRRDHARQLEQTRQGLFLFRSDDEGGTDLARSLHDRTGIPIYDLTLQSTQDLLRSKNLNYSDRESALLLPSSMGWIQIRDEKTIEEALAPLAGAPTPNLLGALAALALAAIWALFAFWRPQIAYLGALWPAIGILAIGVATPLCTGCLADWHGLTPLASIAGIAGFVAVSLLMGLRNRAPTFALAAIALLSVVAATAQAYLLLQQPKFCPGCLLAGAAWAGTFCLAAKGLAESRVRAVLFGRQALAGVTIAGGLLGFRHTQVALTAIAPRSEPSFEVAIGRPLSDFTRSSKGAAPGLYVVAMAGCGACDLARRDLRQAGISFRDLSYCTLLANRGCFQPDFTAVSPLFLICDTDGRITYAEAGWTDDPYKRARTFERFEKHLGNRP